VRAQVATGKLKPGDRLPAIRDLARQLGIDPGTVARAYRDLEREGASTSRRGSGSFISDIAGSASADTARHQRLEAVVNRAVLEGLALGFNAGEVESAFALRLAQWRERRGRLEAGGKPELPPPGLIRFAGSHDAAIELLASHLTSLHPKLRLTTTFVGSLAGLMAVASGGADIAGAHLLDEESGDFNIPFIRRLMPSETVVTINLMKRIQGLMVARSNPKSIIGIEDLRRPDVIFVNRQKGSGTRMLLDSRLLSLRIAPASIKGYQHEETTHIGVAAAVAEGSADAGLGAQSAASLAGLDFIPLIKEKYDLIALKTVFENPRLHVLYDTVHSRSFRDMLTSLPGYDVSETGKLIAVGPNSK
jgi:molybdate-binding protein/DNA-binding transcriptional regulator YhcF (GntR family)